MSKTVAIVQARMGSSRLPCKSLLNLRGVPVINWIDQRLGRSKNLDEILVAVPDTYLDKALQDHLSHHNIPWLAGPENDVLARFAQAIEASRASHVVRICADNPLVSSEAVDQLIDFYHSNQVDYAWNHIPRHNLWPDGLGAEMVSAELLLHMNTVAASPSQREHCFNYIWDNTEMFKLGTFDPEETYLQRPDIKLDMDTPADYGRLAQLALAPDASLRNIIDAWDAAHQSLILQPAGAT